MVTRDSCNLYYGKQLHATQQQVMAEALSGRDQIRESDNWLGEALRSDGRATVSEGCLPSLAEAFSPQPEKNFEEGSF